MVQSNESRANRALEAHEIERARPGVRAFPIESLPAPTERDGARQGAASDEPWCAESSELGTLGELLATQAASFGERFGPAFKDAIQASFREPLPPTVNIWLAGRRGTPCAYGCVRSDGTRAIITNLWSYRNHADDVEALVRRMLRQSRETAQIVEAQDLGFGLEDHSTMLGRLADEIHSRSFLVARPSASRKRSVKNPKSPENLPATWRNWKHGDLLSAAELTESAYRNTLDSHINGDYRGLGGCLRRLANTIEGRGWGRFIPEASPVAVDGFGRLVGFIHLSSLGDGHAHLADVCVAPRVRGQGVGRRLLSRCLRQADELGYAKVSLCVSEENNPARRLYESAGFETLSSFNAYLFGAAR